MSILVRNLPKTFIKEDLEALFFEFGSIVSCDLVMDEVSGVSKGFGFVEMSSQDETDNAIEALNAKMINGKKIRVKWSNQEKKKAATEYEPASTREIPNDVWANAPGAKDKFSNDEK